MSYKDKEKQKEYQREWSRKKFSNPEHREKRRTTKRKHYNDSKERLENYKATLKCSVCDENHPATLDFHHVDPTTKVESVCRMASTHTSWDRIMEEINKCIVLCSNCHRKLHYNQLKDYEIN